MWLWEGVVTEIGAMNLFIYWKNNDGVKEVITSPITNGLILPGVTRSAVIHLIREKNEVPMIEK